MNQSPSPSPCACVDQGTAPETLKLPNEPLLIDPTAEADELQDAVDMRMGQALAMLTALLANDHFRYVSADVLANALDGARHLMEEASVLNTRQWEVIQGNCRKGVCA